MHSLGINGEGNYMGQLLADVGSAGNIAVKTVKCVCDQRTRKCTRSYAVLLPTWQDCRRK